MTGGITYGAAKDDLATVVANGVGSNDPRVRMRTNEATKALLDELIPVGGMMTVDVVADSESILLLPKELENAIEVDVRASADVHGQTDVTQGWNLVTNFTYVDPANAHDNPLVDLGLVPDPVDPTILRRKYEYPGLAAGATVRVTGAKRYVPITADGDYLIVQNVRALKLAILSIEKDENSALPEGEGLLQKAIRILQAEIKKHQLDPTNSLKRKATYQEHLTSFAEGTLGHTRARLALEVPGFLQRGKSEINYLINRAVQMLVDKRNQLAITGRITVNASLTELVYTPALTGSTALLWDDYNQIRLMVQSFITESGDAQAVAVAEEYQKQAFALQEAQLIQQTEVLRHTTYNTALTAYITAGTLTKLGYVRSKLGLELPNGLRLTFEELRRLVNEAALEAANHQNFLARTERYSETSIPQITFAYAQNDDAILSYTNYEVLRLLVLAQLEPSATGLKEQAFALIERNLAQAVEQVRKLEFATLATTSQNTFGGLVGRLGLELMEGYERPKIYWQRLVNEAYAIAIDHYNFVARREEYEATAISFTPLSNDATALPEDIPAEVVKLLVESLLEDQNKGNGTPKKVAAFELIERNLRQTIETARRQTWQINVALAEGSYGRTKARIALDFSTYDKSDAAMGRLVNRALEAIVNRENSWRFSGRYGVRESVTEIAFTPVSVDATILTTAIPNSVGVGDFDIIRRLVHSYLTPDPAEAGAKESEAYTLLEARLAERLEVRRHTTYTTALSTYPVGTYGWTVARLALELEGALKLTDDELERLTDRAEMRLMERGLWRGTLEEFTADLVGGEVLFPVRVLGILAADVCGMPVDIRSVFFEYQKNGPGKACGCETKFTDMGEVYFPESGNTRRRYKFNGSTTAQEINVVAKLRWIKKENADRMTIVNFDGIKLEAQSLLLERAEKWGDAVAVQALAEKELDRDLNDYLGGIQHAINVETDGYGFGDLGQMN